MPGQSAKAVEVLNYNYLQDYPLDAAKQIESMPPGDIAQALATQSAEAVGSLFGWMAPDVAAGLLRHLPEQLAKGILQEMSPNTTLLLLGQFDDDERQRHLSLLDEALRKDLQALMEYPDDSAGRLMDTRVGAFRPYMTVAQALERLRGSKLRDRHTIFVIDDENRLSARVAIHDLADRR